MSWWSDLMKRSKRLQKEKQAERGRRVSVPSSHKKPVGTGKLIKIRALRPYYVKGHQLRYRKEVIRQYYIPTSKKGRRASSPGRPYVTYEQKLKRRNDWLDNRSRVGIEPSRERIEATKRLERQGRYLAALPSKSDYMTSWQRRKFLDWADKNGSLRSGTQKAYQQYRDYVSKNHHYYEGGSKNKQSNYYGGGSNNRQMTYPSSRSYRRSPYSHNTQIPNGAVRGGMTYSRVLQPKRPRWAKPVRIKPTNPGYINVNGRKVVPGQMMGHPIPSHPGGVSLQATGYYDNNGQWHFGSKAPSYLPGSHTPPSWRSGELPPWKDPQSSGPGYGYRVPQRPNPKLRYFEPWFGKSQPYRGVPGQSSRGVSQRSTPNYKGIAHFWNTRLKRINITKDRRKQIRRLEGQGNYYGALPRNPNHLSTQQRERFLRWVEGSFQKTPPKMTLQGAYKQYRKQLFGRNNRGNQQLGPQPNWQPKPQPQPRYDIGIPENPQPRFGVSQPRYGAPGRSFEPWLGGVPQRPKPQPRYNTGPGWSAGRPPRLQPGYNYTTPGWPSPKPRYSTEPWFGKPKSDNLYYAFSGYRKHGNNSNRWQTRTPVTQRYNQQRTGYNWQNRTPTQRRGFGYGRGNSYGYGYRRNRRSVTKWV